MTLTIRTADLCQLLADVALFAADDTHPELAYLHLHVGTATIGGDVHPRQVLAATATDGAVAGHAITEATGTLGRDVLLTVSDALAIVGLWKPIARAVPKEHPPHEVALTVRTAGQDGFELHSQETQLLFDHAGPELAVTSRETDEYPIDALALSFDPKRLARQAASEPMRVVGGVRTGRPVEPVRTDLSASRLGDFAKVAARRSSTIRVFRYHQDLRILAQIGDHFTGSLGAVAIEEGAQVDGPESPRVFPDASYPEGMDTVTGEVVANDEPAARDSNPPPSAPPSVTFADPDEAAGALSQPPAVVMAAAVRLTARGRLLAGLAGWAAFLVALAAAVALLWLIA